jgi:hypothetical protein
VSEQYYFAALLHAGDAGALRLVDPERDLSTAWQAVYAWIVAFQRERGALPKPLTVSGQFSIALDKPPESAGYYASIVSRNVKRARLEEELSQKVVPRLEGHDPDGAIAATAEAIGQVRSEFPEPNDARAYLANMGVNVGERWLDYQFRTQHGDMLGLPLPWASITRMTLGMQPGEAWAFVARPGVGKSWMAIALAVYLWQMGYRVLFASMETPPRNAIPRSPRTRARLGSWADVARQRLTLRIDAIGARVSAWRLLNGKLNPYEVAQYQRYLKMCEAEGSNGWGALRVVSTPRVRTIGQLEQEANEFEPDLVIWDSAYIAIPRGSATKRTDLAGLFLEDCKATFERLGVPGLLTWHFNREVKENDTEASLNDIALTDDMPRLFDAIFFLFRTAEMQAAGEALWRSGKIRDGVGMPELRTRLEVKRSIDFSEIALGSNAPPAGQQPTTGAVIGGGQR